MKTLSWVDFEVIPYSVTDHENQTVEIDGRGLWHSLGAGVTMINRLREIVDAGPDETRCEASGCQDNSLHPTGPRYIGDMLVEPDEVTLLGSGIHWRWLTLVAQPDGTILAVCEECSPTNLYVKES